MKYWDLTREISPESVPYPGDPPVVFTAETEIERDSFRLRNLSFSSHIGTHIDAPAHVFSEGKCLNDFPLEIFIGPATIFKLGKVRPKTAITREMLELFSESFQETFQECSHLLFSAQWDGDFFEDAPFFTLEAARWLVGKAQLLLIGFDWPSPDEFGDEDLPIHREFLRHDLLFVENLTNLETLPTQFQFTSLPLSLQDAEGAPCRAIAFSNNYVE
ncbi:MAG: cyclase family protein [Planctomycetia bacterium]|nr:cyclase family protein [Planctomycetia bacterium]